MPMCGDILFCGSLSKIARRAGSVYRLSSLCRMYPIRLELHEISISMYYAYTVTSFYYFLCICFPRSSLSWKTMFKFHIRSSSLIAHYLAFAHSALSLQHTLFQSSTPQCQLFHSHKHLYGFQNTFAFYSTTWNTVGQSSRGDQQENTRFKREVGSESER